MKLSSSFAAALPVVAVLTLLSGAAEAASAQCEAVRQQYPGYASKHLNIALDNASPGLAERSTTAPKEWSGFIPDMLEAFSRCLGFDYTLTGAVSSGTIEALAQNRFDLLADDLRPTEARQKKVRFLQFIISPARY